MPLDQSGPAIIYEDAEIRVIWHQGRSDFVLITFGDGLDLADGTKFFGDGPAIKSNVSAIGFMAKSINFYPEENIRRALPLVMEHVRRYDVRVAYGGSMGGYGALKYSGLVAATDVVSLCPQWSIDPAECVGWQPRGGRRFVPSLARMGIRPRDVSGNITVFVDMRDRQDRDHCTALTEAVPGIKVMNVPMVGHHVTATFAGTQNLWTIVRLSRDRDYDELRRTIRALRRKKIARVTTVMDAAIARHPGLASRLLTPPQAPYRSIARHNLRFLYWNMTWLLAKDGYAAAAAYVDSCRGLLREPLTQLMVAAFLAECGGGEVELAGETNTRLVFRVSAGRCLHVSELMPANDYLVKIEMAGTAVALFIEIGGTRFYMGVDGRGNMQASYTSGAGDLPPRFDIASTTPGTFTLSRDGLLLSLDINGTMAFKAQAAGERERLRFRVRPRA